jgi:hypothetical protein
MADCYGDNSVSTYPVKVDEFIDQLSEFRLVQSQPIFFLFSWGGVRLSLLGTSATNWPIVPAPGDR